MIERHSPVRWRAALKLDLMGSVARSGAQKLQQRLGSRLGGGWVLAGDKSSVSDDEARPVCRLLIESTQALQLILDEERHDFGELDRRLLAIGEAGHPFTLHDRFALEP